MPASETLSRLPQNLQENDEPPLPQVKKAFPTIPPHPGLKKKENKNVILFGGSSGLFSHGLAFGIGAFLGLSMSNK